MYKIVEKRLLAPAIYSMKVEAPRLATAAAPGQFLILLADAKGERIPLTICDYDAAAGTVTVVIQAIGASTRKIVEKEVGESFYGFVGPLGHPSEFVKEDITGKKFLFVAGGLGAAPVYPQVKWLAEHGVEPTVILGAKSAEYLIFEDEFRALTPNVHIATDDGSKGFAGLVTGLIEQLAWTSDKGQVTSDTSSNLVAEPSLVPYPSSPKFDEVIAIGPMIMMKFVALTTAKLGIKTIVSLNTIMVDGTGMCGACRVTVDGVVRFACVEGPEFDGHKVDWDEALRRMGMYRDFEHKCNIR